jgi:hypothetical protein
MAAVITPTPVTRPRGRSGASAPTPTGTTTVDNCVRLLKEFGYGTTDPHEMARLYVYAGAAAGNIEEAIEMIEEDRAAATELVDGKDFEEINNMENGTNLTLEL